MSVYSARVSLQWQVCGAPLLPLSKDDARYADRALIQVGNLDGSTHMSVGGVVGQGWPSSTEALYGQRGTCEVESGPPRETLTEVFAATVQKHPARTAIDAPGATLDYAETLRLALSLASELRGRGVGPGDRVGVRVPSGTAELYLAVLGVLQSGAAYVPVDAEDSESRAERVFASAGVCAVVGEGLRLELLRPPMGQDREPTPEDDAWVIFTSGSTGEPKGVAVTHRSAAAFVRAEQQLWVVRPDDRVLAGLSVSFDASCEEMWLAWANGGALVPAPRAVVRSGDDLGAWLRERLVTVVSTVPTLAGLLDEHDLHGVRLLVLGGEACANELGWRLAAGREVWNTYGPTEATVVSTAARIRPGEPVAIGHPLEGWNCAVISPDEQPVPWGEEGELVIGGVGLGRYIDTKIDTQRYAALPALGWSRAYRTGDIVRETTAGLAFVGRRDDQVKIAGRRLELGEVDSVLAAVPGVRAASAAVRMTASGDRVLVAYVVGDVDPARLHEATIQRLPAGVVPVVVALPALPTASSGKIDRRALPWPPPVPEQGEGDGEADESRSWLRQRWQEHLGLMPTDDTGDFFQLGGTSVSAAKLASALRTRYPGLTVADLYTHRRFGAMLAHLQSLLDTGERQAHRPGPGPQVWEAARLAGVGLLTCVTAARWLVGVVAVDKVLGVGPATGVSWLVLALAWALLVSAPGRALLVMLARRALVNAVTPGRYPRNSWTAWRLWFVDRLAATSRLNSLAGTPWAARYARLGGNAVIGRDVVLHTLPPTGCRITIGDGATIERAVELHDWWIDGPEVVVGEIVIGPQARIGARSHLMPGAVVGARAEVEPGAVVSGVVAPEERWAGSPGRCVGVAATTACPTQDRRHFLWRWRYVAGLLVLSLLPLAAALPDAGLQYLALGPAFGLTGFRVSQLVMAPALAFVYVMSFAACVAAAFRCAARRLRPGLHDIRGPEAWASWFTESLLETALPVMFPIYSSVYTRAWVRLLGIHVGPHTEMSHATTINPLVTLGSTSFAADDVAYLTSRWRSGTVELRPVEIGNSTFLGNGAIVEGGSRLEDGVLVGVLSSAPPHAPNGSTWFGAPPIEFPRVPATADPSRTTSPPRPLVLARGAVEILRIVVPSSVATAIGWLVLVAANSTAMAKGMAAMVCLLPVLLIAAGVAATSVTVALKWLLIGRYRPGVHPLWSWFVWRDEIINTAQEQLSGAWLLDGALGTSVMSLYLRAMGARVGRRVWFESLIVTEFDVVDLQDDSVVNRSGHIETHLFQDRLLRIGPTRLEAGATLGTYSAVLPDTVVGADTTIGARSVVLGGEHLPPRTRWHGSPVRPT